jgi:hypothetical protein
MTLAEFHRIWLRADRASRTFGQTVCLRIEAAGAVVGPWPLCRLVMERTARREYARLVAARDQYEAACRDATAAWLMRVWP